MGPVRVGNQAYQQVQNDVYGDVILAAIQYFFDSRVAQPGTVENFERLEILGERAAQLYDEPDAGIWEYRGRKRVHTFSSVMCWAACDRLAKIAEKLSLPSRAKYWRDTADALHADICRQAWDDDKQAFTESFGRPELDASMLLLNHLGFLSADDPRFLSTVAAIESELRRGDHLLRYGVADDFGEPENAFNICTFWYIDALAAKGQGIVNRIDAALGFAEQLFAAQPAYAAANPQVPQRIAKMKEQNRHYLAHEYFNRDWHPMSVAKMAEWLAPARRGALPP